jgi:nicotinamidase-related amidase
MSIDSVVIIGALTNGCVESTGRSASDLGYKTILIDDASATIDQVSQDATMKAFAWIFGKVMDTDQIIAILSKQLQGTGVAVGS